MWWGRDGPVNARQARHSRIRERVPRRYSRRNSWLNSLLKLLLPLLQFLQELLGRLDRLPVLLLLLLLVISSGRLVVPLISLVSLISLIIRRRIIRISGVGRIIRRIIRGILTLHDNSISSWSRGGHGRHGAGIDVLVSRARLFGRRRTALGRIAGLSHQDHAIQSSRVGRRTQQKVIEVGSIEQRTQHVSRRSWTKRSDHPFRRITRNLDGRTRLRPNRFQNVAQGGILGRNGQLTTLEGNLGWRGWLLRQRWWRQR